MSNESCGKRSYRAPSYYTGPKLTGNRFELSQDDPRFPKSLKSIPVPPNKIYGVGEVEALAEGLAVIGARKATPYGLSCSYEFAAQAANKGIVIISGGAYGCDSQAHRAALSVGGRTVAILGGGCNELYPARHYALFQEIVDNGGAVISEQDWDFPPIPFTFRQRNRLIAGLAKATLIVEAGLPSGTFSTADEALGASKDVLVVPGSITSPTSAGSNRLLYQGATPIVDAETFDDVLFGLFGVLRQPSGTCEPSRKRRSDKLLNALNANPMRMDEIMKTLASTTEEANPDSKILIHLSELERDGLISRYPDGRFGPAKVNL